MKKIKFSIIVHTVVVILLCILGFSVIFSGCNSVSTLRLYSIRTEDIHNGYGEVTSSVKKFLLDKSMFAFIDLNLNDKGKYYFSIHSQYDTWDVTGSSYIGFRVIVDDIVYELKGWQSQDNIRLGADDFVADSVNIYSINEDLLSALRKANSFSFHVKGLDKKTVSEKGMNELRLFLKEK